MAERGAAVAAQVARGGLRDGPGQHLIDGHVRWPGHHPDDAIGDVGTRERLHPFVNGRRPLVVPLESPQAEFGLHQSRLDLRYPNWLTHELESKRLGDGADRMLAGRVPNPTGVDLEAGDRTQVDDIRAGRSP